MALLQPPPTKPITLPDSAVLAGDEKKCGKPSSKGEKVSYEKVGLTTVAVTQNLLSGMPLVLIIELMRLWNSILHEPLYPGAELSKLICLIACKKAKHRVSRGYRSVHIP